MPKVMASVVLLSVALLGQYPNYQTVAPVFRITTGGLPDAIANTAYSQTLTAASGTAPYTWSIVFGSLPTGLSLHSATGVIDGTPTVLGISTFTVLATDSSTPTALLATQQLTIQVVCAPLQILSQSPLPPAIVGSADNFQFLSQGGFGSITWANPGGGIPTSTSLSSGGLLSGSPTVPGQFNFNISATDSCPTPQVVTTPFSQQVNSALTITTTSPLPNGTRGSPYSAQLSASGGTTPYTWTKTGTLPASLSLSSAGVISGTPTNAETDTFTAIVTDAAAVTNNAQFTITITCPALSITSTTLPVGTQGQPYSFQLLSQGGSTPVTWSILSGTLDPGLALSSGGLISGTPTSPNTYMPTIAATDSCTPTAKVTTQQFSLTVVPQLTITTASLPNGVQGVPYSATVAAQGGQPVYTWSVPSGTVPTGAIDLLDWELMPLPARNNFHMAGSSNPTYSVLQGGLLWNIKSNNGNPWDIRYYDDTYIYFWFTENNDSDQQAACQAAGYTGCFVDPFAYKQAQNTRPWTPRYFVPGSTVTIMTPPVLTSGNVNPGIRTTNCGSDNQPIRYLGNVKTVTSGPSTVAWGGSVGTQPTIENDYYYGGNISGVYNDRERYYFVKGFGRVGWDHASWNGSTFVVDQTTTNNNKVAGGAPIPNFACGIPNLPQAGTLPTGVVIKSGPSLNLNDATGIISGIPNSSGVSTFNIQVEDSLGAITNRQLSITVTCPALTLNSTSPLPQGTMGQTYNVGLSATGGATPLSWNLVSGTLPPGLSLSAAGVISGTPTATGTFNFVGQVLDSCNPQQQSQQKPFTIAIAANSGPLTITTTTPLPGGKELVPYSQQLTVTGGTSPYTWSLSAGTLPAGLTLSSTGLISGTPTATSVSAFTVRVTDAISGTTTKALSLTITCTALAFTSTSPLPVATVNQPYSFQFATSGYTGTVTFSGTSVPAGLTLSSTGLLSGTPTSAATTTINVTATDSCNPTPQSVGPTGFSLTVNAAIPALAVTSTSPLPGATEGQAYNAQLTASGGVPPYTWTITVGSLQAGLSLSAGGAITGTPTSASTVTPTFQVTDSASTNATKVLSLTVACPAFSVSSTSPLPPATQNVAYNFTFISVGGAGTITWTATGVPAGMTLSSAGVLSGTPTGTGTSTINVTATDSCSPTPQTIGPNGYSLTINPAPNPLQINTPTPLPSATRNVAYSATLTATGGTPPYGSWTVTVGTLPTGLSLAGATGIISGTPTVAGTSSFTVQVTDAVPNNATKAFTLTVANLNTADNRYCNVNETTNFTSPIDGPATLPTRCVHTAMTDTPAAGPTKTVCASGCDFTTITAASTAASAGWIIQIKATTGGVQNVFGSAVISTSGTATNWIIYESDQIANCPAEGSRISPAWVGVPSMTGYPTYAQPASPGIYMPKIRGGNNTITLNSGVHHIRFVCLEVTTTSGIDTTNTITQTNNDHIIWDRIYNHGGDSPNGRSINSHARGWSWSGCTYCAIVDSYVIDYHCKNGGSCQDAQGVLLGGNSASTEGPWKVTGTFLEAAAEPAFSGGGGTGATNTVPHDLEFRRNHTFHPLFWKLNDPSYFGTSFCVKNLLELKNVDRVLIEGNIIEQTWQGQCDQNGHAVILAAKNQASAFGGTASSNGSGTITKLSGAIAFNNLQVSPNCATPLHCNFRYNGLATKVQTVIDATHITVSPAPSVTSSASFLACQPGQNPNAQVTNVTVRYNQVSHSKNGFQIFAGLSDCGDKAAGTSNVSIHDVALDDIDGATWISSGGARSGNQSLPMGQISNDIPAPNNLHDITVRHVTGLGKLSNGNPAGAFGPGIAFTHQSQAGTSIANLKFYDNIFAAGLRRDQIGVCSAATDATSVLACVTSIGGSGAASYCFDHNILAITTASASPVGSTGTANNPPWPSASPNCPFAVSGNPLPASYDAILFTNLNGANGGNYQLQVGSPYHNTASDGTDPGVNWNLLQQAIAGVN